MCCKVKWIQWMFCYYLLFVLIKRVRACVRAFERACLFACVRVNVRVSRRVDGLRTNARINQKINFTSFVFFIFSMYLIIGFVIRLYYYMHCTGMQLTFGNSKHSMHFDTYKEYYFIKLS